MGKLEMIVEPGKQELTMTRTFDAPRDVVFRAYTDPDLVRQWWGLRNSTTIVDRLEPRHGGA